ncbi:GNAT family N-acetyltransferase [Novosphingobium album (ex Hu et al. 2023)]|uniref:GNAT family N-acetyltransferase n=1 Tax=Novosphingobium album (ex Hu et al. 2023) TaxID=2930093 RepID=A0ABT0B0E6_9SPHN|nr:GNAT family N-acetyltransferase [Novosphingobium album (ex Hu et al. 2023)]MCJ2178536.1 GNAT family N-acetyltransferase [Novosphingobium album (ex Hu et al. 2023)]
MFIRSERLFLRPGWPEDWQEVMSLIGDETVVRNLANVPWPYTDEDARSFLALPQEQGFPRFLITVPGTSGAAIIGGAGLNRTDAVPELGYWIARDHWGRGYASEAARAVLGLARAMGHERITATHFIDNPASGRVLEKAGFRRTGRVSERFSKGRGKACPSREYERVFGAPGDCGDGNDLMRCKCAA